VVAEDFGDSWVLYWLWTLDIQFEIEILTGFGQPNFDC